MRNIENTKRFRVILGIVFLFLSVSSRVFAYDFKVNGLCYNKLSENAVELTWEAINTPYTGDIVIPSYINYNGIRYDVVAIGESAMASVYSTGNSGPNAWDSNDKLHSVSIPSTIISIGNYAFALCRGLVSITIPASLTSIGEEAFSDCSGLTSITIPNSVTSIGNRAFVRCSGLISLKVDEGNKNYDSRNNCNAIIETSSNTLITGCKNTSIPSSVTSIGQQAFHSCSGLTSITIPTSIKSIGDYAFSYCGDLTSIIIPNSVTSIGEYNQEIKGVTNVEIIPVIA